jgi:hypothetical protein
MKLLAPLVLFPLFAANVHAGGIVPSQIDARARWVAHVDIEGFSKTSLYQSLLEADTEKEIEQGLSELLATEGIDLFRDVRGATVYGIGPDEASAIALIATTAAAEPMLARWQEETGAKPIDVAGHACLSWGKDDETAYSFLRVTPDSKDRLLVVSKSKDALAQALEVIEGKRVNLAKQPSEALDMKCSSGTFAFVAATGIFDEIQGLGEIGPQSAVARMAKSVRVEVGEHDGRFSFDARLTTERDEDAVKVQQIAQGLLALVSLASEEPEVGDTLGRWMKALQLTRDQKTIRLHFEYDLKLLIQEARHLEDLDKDDDEEGDGK